MLPDQKARDEAVNPRLSAIVQAPAGSGKTELLTKRFLNLLLTVRAPEQVVALTFTRKAAFEMRERILKRLKDNPEVLAHDAKHNWQLLQNPGRLRITTIDALCYSLTQSLPLSEEHTPFTRTTDTPEKFYWEAARNTLQYAYKHAPYQETIRVLLKHLDNRVDTLLSLFVDKLKCREQWLRPVLHARAQDRATLEAALKTMTSHALEQLKAALPKYHADELITLASQVASIENNPNSARYILCGLQHIDDLDAARAQGLATLLLTSSKGFRKAFDHHVGLKRTSCAKDTYDALKADSKALLEALSEAPGFLEALIRVQSLPKPHYPDTSWQPLQALLQLLPLLAGHLRLCFQAHQVSDFIGISEQALAALGDEDNPTDLALHLDYTMQHLLVDEFQDTSIQQYELIARLSRGFEAHDGRTLFVVGDPMQSIYRFRAAEVGLFLQAQQHGIGSVRLKPLYLSVNFRTCTPLIQWFNTQFKSIFPPKPDIESGAVSFHAATPKDESTGEPLPLTATSYATKDEEAEAIALICQKHIEDNPKHTIAILVRSRNQIAAITSKLAAHNIPFQGLDTELLVQLPHVQDVWSLTQALLMPSHKLAWLAVLRSPFAGFSLADIYEIANFNKDGSIVEALCDEACADLLSEEGQKRLPFIRDALKQALETRHQHALVTWVLHTLQALHMHTVLSSQDILDLDPFFALLESFSEDGFLSDIPLFEQSLYRTYQKVLTDAPVQLMTIHKSKGLEFDFVILPGLGKRSPPKHRPLLRWLTLPSEDKEPLFLISPLHKTQGERDVIYDYLGELDTEKNRYEQARLLYVAVTRAKQGLYCLDHHEKTHAHTFRAYLSQVHFQPEALIATTSHEATLPKRIYLPWKLYKAQPKVAEANNPPVLTLPEPDVKRELGILTHELIEWICSQHIEKLEQVPWSLITHKLPLLGLSPSACDAALRQIQHWTQTLLNHPKGRWIVQKHLHEHNEYELLIAKKGRCATIILDRVFETDEACWIVDFKTGEKLPEHQTQLNRYAKAMQPHTKKPISCGLLYLEEGEWEAWAFREKYGIMHAFDTESI